MSRNISQLHPTLQEKISELKKICKKQGLIICISECLRTVEEQNDLYAKGRTDKTCGIVTNAKGSSYSSMHQWGVAFDFYRNDGKGAYYDSDGFFSKVGKIGQSIGLEWGGSWKSIKDTPHFQLPNWGSGTSKLKKLYGTPDRFMKTWKAIKKTVETTTTVKKEDDEVTQAQFNTMMNTYLESLKDDAPNDWSADARKWAESNGIIVGDDKGRKEYKAFCTREQMAQFLYRMSGLK